MDHQFGLIPFEQHPSGMSLDYLGSGTSSNLWLRPILLNAVSDDGLDLIEIDVRGWFEKTARTDASQVKTLCESWFCVDSTDEQSSVIADLLRTYSADSALFLHRVNLRKTGWTCSIDRNAVTRWLHDKAPALSVFIDPLMLGI